MADSILVINAGSSSIKFASFTLGGAGPALAFKGQIEGIGATPRFSARDATGARIGEQGWPAGTVLNHEGGFAFLRDWLESPARTTRPVAVGHRVVHGGLDFAAPVSVDETILARLRSLAPLAPLHQPHNLAGIAAAARMYPGLKQIACFDTAFHRGRPAVADRFAIPRRFEEAGVRRYGFHGISYEFILRRLGEIAPAEAGGRVIVAHLGNGASLCAIRDGQAIDTTMGFTPLDGLVMGTRCGALDPGVIPHLEREFGIGAQAAERLLYNESGLLGVSGISADMRDLLASTAPRAQEAVDLYVWRMRRELGALVATMGGLDTLVFTAGIGENAAPIRAALCRDMAWLGLDLDDAANATHEAVISTPVSRVAIRVIPTDEERMIALHAVRLLSGG